jgi:hypothetical protein
MIDNEIQSRMDAFRGNPQALMQRYAQSQQLLDLLALQKLKSEKEAAARQMQMQAGQGQMPTVAQQREQELMGMAKQEVAQRVGQVAQQQAKQQQENLQRAAQTGIAQAPAPNMMPAQAMASGGIVAFAGPEGSYVEGEDEPRLPGESDEEYLERVGGSPFTRGLKRFGKSAMEMLTAPSPIQDEEYARLRDLERNVLPQYSRGMFARMTPEQERAEQAVQTFYRQNKEQIVKEPGLYEAFKRDPVGVAYGRTSTQREAVGKVGAPASAFGRADQSYATKEARGIPAPQAAPETPPGVPPGQRPAGPLPPPGGAGLGDIALPTARPGAMPPGAPQAAATPQAAPAQQPMGIQAPLEKTLTGALEASPEAAAAAEEAGYRKRLDPLYQKQLELQQQGISQLQQRMAEQPKKDPLTEFLRGMSTQRTLGMALGAGGAGISAAQRANFEQQAALQDQLQKLREAEALAQVTQETARYGAGKEAAKTAADARKAAMQSGTTYAVGMENAKNREEAARMQAQQVADRALMAKMLTPAQIVSAQDKAGDNITAMLGKDIALQMKVNKGEVSRAELVHQEFIRLISLAAPELAAQLRASGPASGPAIPPPPKDAVKLMSKGN